MQRGSPNDGQKCWLNIEDNKREGSLRESFQLKISMLRTSCGSRSVFMMVTDHYYTWLIQPDSLVSGQLFFIKSSLEITILAVKGNGSATIRLEIICLFWCCRSICKWPPLFTLQTGHNFDNWRSFDLARALNCRNSFGSGTELPLGH